MSQRSKLLTFGLPVSGLVCLTLGVFLVAFNHPVNEPENPPRQPVKAPEMASEKFIGATGLSEPPGEAIAIASHKAGIITDVLVKVGQEIKAGTTLFKLDSRTAETDILLKESVLKEATTALAAASAMVEVEHTKLLERENLLAIAKAITDKRAISKEEFDQRRFSVQQAQAALAVAKAKKEQAQANLEKAQQDLNLAKINLELLHVKSPVNSRVLQVNIRPGEFAPASMASRGLIVLGKTGPTHIRVEIDEVDIPRLDTSRNAWATPRGNAQKRYPLSFVKLEPLVVPKRNLSGRTSELVDTRVQQVVYEFKSKNFDGAVGQQFDVYIETEKE